MVNFAWAVSASVVVSLISLVGIFSLLLKDNLLDKALFVLVGFSAGGLIGGAFLHLLPEALEESSTRIVFPYLILGFIFFFILEKYLHWRHCHEDHCAVHTFTYLNLVGDGVHNFIDGLIIGSSFLVGIHFGVVTTLVLIFHEIPQEIGDFGTLVYGGFSRAKALYCNFMIALTCVIGTVGGFFLGEYFNGFTSFLLPFTAGGFIYIGACDLIPELHKQPGLKKSISAMLSFICGILFILLTTLLGKH